MFLKALLVLSSIHVKHYFGHQIDLAVQSFRSSPKTPIRRCLNEDSGDINK